ncbi:hypothetical protein K2173_018868 [Erythroxylum novogranatense]|uniref:Uncharacterized protein n=1 Tax=Erythroxylum novogranatense TaxID=1862640 RepID=A0AAV8SBE9_9ROSI|nr:hypothetical protein K2173_018868 [Erythroxylum novogranatense]
MGEGRFMQFVSGGGGASLRRFVPFASIVARDTMESVDSYLSCLACGSMDHLMRLPETLGAHLLYWKIKQTIPRSVRAVEMDRVGEARRMKVLDGRRDRSGGYDHELGAIMDLLYQEVALGFWSTRAVFRGVSRGGAEDDIFLECHEIDHGEVVRPIGSVVDSRVGEIAGCSQVGKFLDVFQEFWDCRRSGGEFEIDLVQCSSISIPPYRMAPVGRGA